MTLRGFVLNFAQKASQIEVTAIAKQLDKRTILRILKKLISL